MPPPPPPPHPAVQSLAAHHASPSPPTGTRAPCAQVYAIDLLGFGASDKPVLDYSIELWASQINAFCSEFIDRPVVLVGNSIGSLSVLTVGGAQSCSTARGADHAAASLPAAAPAAPGGFPPSPPSPPCQPPSPLPSMAGALQAAAATPAGSLRGVALLNSAGAMNNKGVVSGTLSLDWSLPPPTATSHPSLLRAHDLPPPPPPPPPQLGDWRIILAYPLFLLIDLLLKTRPIASRLFTSFAQPANVQQVLQQVRPPAPPILLPATPSMAVRAACPPSPQPLAPPSCCRCVCQHFVGGSSAQGPSPPRAGVPGPGGRGPGAGGHHCGALQGRQCPGRVRVCDHG